VVRQLFYLTLRISSAIPITKGKGCYKILRELKLNSNIEAVIIRRRGVCFGGGIQIFIEFLKE